LRHHRRVHVDALLTRAGRRLLDGRAHGVTVDFQPQLDAKRMEPLPTHGCPRALPEAPELFVCGRCGVVGQARYRHQVGFLRPLFGMSPGLATASAVDPASLAHAAADFFPALAVFAVSLAVGETRVTARLALAGVLLGVAAIGGVMLGWYLWRAHETFGFWVAPPLYRDVHRLTASGALQNFAGYAGYLVVLTLPMSILLPGAMSTLTRHWRALALTTLVLFLLGGTLLHVQGEMGFGPLDRVLSRRVTGGGFLVLCAALLVPLVPAHAARAGDARMQRLILAGTVVILAALAMTLPAQRYLLFLIPFHVLALPLDLARPRWRLIATGVVWAAVNGFIGYSQWCTGTAARQMTERIDAAGLLAVTDPGDVASHVGDRFFQRQGGIPVAAPAYVVRAGRLEGAEMSVTSGWAFLPRSYSLVRIRPQ
jgi:hypothetical protein